MPDAFKDFIRDGICDVKRVLSLSTQDLREPIIVCKTRHWGKNHPTIPDNLLVDGHHRMARYALTSAPAIPAFWLSPDQWEPFQVTNLPSTTIERLCAEGPVPKPYWSHK